MSDAPAALGPGREFDVLRAAFARLAEQGAASADLGDDCALVPVGGTTLALSIDLAVEGVHFRTDWLSFEEIGWRATAAALSDLAAEGAEPIGVLVSVGSPGDAGKGKGDGGGPVAEIVAGAGAAVASVGGRVLGGDLVKSPHYLVDVCVLGHAPHPVRRAGAGAGDGVWVTGRLGGAGLALAGLRAGVQPPAEILRRYAHPEPRIAAGRWLASHGATAMLDISDGLAQDAGHLAAASGVAIEIAIEQVPCWPAVPPLAAAASGEEFELLVTLPKDFAAAADFTTSTGLPLTRIGWCAAGHGVRTTHHAAEVSISGYDHFAP